MSGGSIDVEILDMLVMAASRSPQVAASRPGLSFETAALKSVLLSRETDDLDELIEDVLSVAARTVSLLIRSAHGGELCGGCLAQSVFRYSLEVAGEMDADDAAKEPDEGPSETPPFSGSIN